MARIVLTRRPLDQSELLDDDRVMITPAAAVLGDDATDEQRRMAAAANPPEMHALSALRTFIQGDLATETGPSIVTALEALAAGSRLSYNALDDRPTIPTLRTAAETRDLLQGLRGLDRLDAGAIKNLPQPQDGGLISVTSDGTLTGLGTATSVLAVAEPYTAAERMKLIGIEPNATSDQSANEIIEALEGQDAGSRLSYTALDDLPTIPPVLTAASAATLLRGLPTPQNAFDNDTVFGWDTSEGAGAEFTFGQIALRALVGYGNQVLTTQALADDDRMMVRQPTDRVGAITLQTLATFVNGKIEGSTVRNLLENLSGGARLSYSAIQGTPTIPTDNFDKLQFSIAELLQRQGTGDALPNATAGNTVGKDLQFGNIRDAALLGVNHATGRLEFSDIPSDSDTNLLITGRVPISHVGLGGQLRILFREYTAVNTISRTTVVAVHQIEEAAASRSLLMPLTDTPVLARQGRSYRLFVEFTAEASTNPSPPANGRVTLDYVISNDANLIAFRQFKMALTDLTDTPSTAGTAGQALVVASGGGYEFVDVADTETGATIVTKLAALTGEARLSYSNLKDTPTTNDLFTTLRGANALTTLADADTVFGWDASAAAGVEMSLSNLRTYMQPTQAEVSALLRAAEALSYTNLQANDRVFGYDQSGTKGLGITLENLVQYVEANADIDVEFAQVESLPTPLEFGMTADLLHLDSAHGAEPGLWRTVNNPVEMRNRTVVTIDDDAEASNVFGASVEPANPFGHINNSTMVGKIVWSTASPRYNNIALNTALTGNRTVLYIDYGSSEFGTDITRRIRYNRGTTTGNFTSGGRTYRNWTVDTTELDQSDDEVVQRLMELQDASGDNDLTIDIYTAATGDASTRLNHLPEFVWEGELSQQRQRPFLHTPNRADRILMASEIFADNNVLRNYQTKALAESDLPNLVDGEAIRVRNTTPGSSDADSEVYVVNGAIAATGGTKGAVSHRNRFSARLFTMGDNNGFYYTAGTPSAKRTFNNVQDADNIDRDVRILSFSVFDSGGTGNRPYVEMTIDPGLTTRQTIALAIGNRINSTSGNEPTLDVDIVRTGETAPFAGKSGNVYRYTLNSDQSSRLATAGYWLFRDDVVVLDLSESHQRSESVINFNPDTVEFTTGTGYVAPTGAVAAKLQQIGGGGGGVGENLLSVNQSLGSTSRDIGVRLVAGELYVVVYRLGWSARNATATALIEMSDENTEIIYALDTGANRFSQGRIDFFNASSTSNTSANARIFTGVTVTVNITSIRRFG